MASKGPRSKLDHETRAKRQKVLEAPREPRRPKSHWDHVLEEMQWLSKDFESERKWKLAQAKKVAIRASKCILDQASRGERRMKEEEQRVRKVAVNISKEIKKFWMKIEKLVLYKHQLEVEERKKKALDKQLDFLLGQTERYSTMLAENLVHMHGSDERLHKESGIEPIHSDTEGNAAAIQPDESLTSSPDVDNDYGIQSEDESEDDEHTIEEDEALITEDERREELVALHDEVDLPLEELLARYTVSKEVIPECDKEQINHILDGENQATGYVSYFPHDSPHDQDSRNTEVNHDSTPQSKRILTENPYRPKPVDSANSDRELTMSKLQHRHHPKRLTLLNRDYLPIGFTDEVDDQEYVGTVEEEKDDETTLSEEEELALKEANDPFDEIKLLQNESEIPIEELLARYRKDGDSDGDFQIDTGSSYSLESSDDQYGSHEEQEVLPAYPNVSFESKTYKNQSLVEVDSLHSKAEVDREMDDEPEDEREAENIIADAAAAARSAQPTGITFSTTKVRTKFPFLLKHPLREYQHIGLDWLVTMYEKRLNGILADEMGLGKTIMTISLLAHLACEKGIWGPHLIVVPTSVMLNWETEFLKWCPAFKILTYFGNAKERKLKRQGWLKPNSFHICITTYRLVIQDSKVFKRKKWKYLILDEAHLIKNWKSQRWQTLLNFNSKRRILLTGTPLQNDLMELWSLMHFLMPHIFQSHQEFKDWFSNPITSMVEGQENVNKDVVDRLHNVLRPFILRRLKCDVEKQLPKKHEHVIYCRLSRRQRNLYEDFIASSETQATLASGNFFGMISVIMQLRKVCNHPDLFEGRPIISSFDMAGIDMQLSTSVCNILSLDPFSDVDLKGFNFIFSQYDFSMTSWEYDEVNAIAAVLGSFERGDMEDGPEIRPCTFNMEQKRIHGSNIFQEIQKSIWEERLRQAKERASAIAWWNLLCCQRRPVYGTDLIELVSVRHPVLHIHEQKNRPSSYMGFSSKLADIILLPVERFLRSVDLVEQFLFAIPAARAPFPVCWCSRPFSPVFLHPAYEEECTRVFSPLLSPIRPAIIRRQVYFPDRRLIQFDCGKLQELAILLRRLKSEGHRALIFTQMTKMLDILEAFINLYGYTYMRLDGSTQPEERQTLMQRFNTNPKYFLFILSTRSGGVGINLVGADTVIFYDSDWNPAMDQQAQDRCHRIGQTREVHIYRLISESTIEENILKKANQKRALDNLVIQSGSYNTEFFKKLNPMELFPGHETVPDESYKKGTSDADYGAEILSNADVEAALKQAEDEADYMALKKVEQEEAVENQEFAEEAIGRIEDDELANEDDVKLDDVANEEIGCLPSFASKDNSVGLQECNISEDKALTLTERDEDIDMLADVKQMAAAAAAAGQSYSLFENQLRPIDRYAMRFLDLWDPIIDKSEVQNEVSTDKEDWELDQIQKLKEEMEAEMDDDEETFVYKTWDAEFATEAYKQHVEALAQQQLLEELESEALDAKDAGQNTTTVISDEGMKEHKSKIKKKKSKKAKFKSLKKGSLASGKEIIQEEADENQEPVVDEVSPMIDISQDSPSHVSGQKKRKLAATEDEKSLRKVSKKSKRSTEMSKVDSESSEKHVEENKAGKSSDGVADVDPRLASRSKMGGKISISPMPVKHIMVVRQDKPKKKGNYGSKDYIPLADPWASQEDAVLCAAVHEYGTNWNLIVDVLYSMTSGGYFRGRFRHPVHCCDRFRELFFKYILSGPDSPNIEKISAYGPGKAPLKVTEDQVDILLNIASDLPNNELLLQKHFAYLLSAAWRMKHRFDVHCGVSTSQNGLHTFKALGCQPKRLTENMHPTVIRQCSEVVAATLSDVNQTSQEVSPVPHNQPKISPEDVGMEVTLEFPEELASACLFPPTVKLPFSSSVTQLSDASRDDSLSKVSKGAAEQRFRATWETCIEGETPHWTTSTFSTGGNARVRTGSKSQSSGKQKSLTDSVKLMKSKLSKTLGASEESKSNFPEPLSLSLFSASDEGFETSSSDGILGADNFLALDSPFSELLNCGDLVYDCDPGVIAGLEDLDLSRDVTEYG